MKRPRLAFKSYWKYNWLGDSKGFVFYLFGFELIKQLHKVTVTIVLLNLQFDLSLNKNDTFKQD